jgi:hypothetical protein
VPRLRIPVLLKDADAEVSKQFDATELRTIEVDSLLPGPVSDRVAIVDFMPDGDLAKAAALPEGDIVQVSAANPYTDPLTIRWSLFATVIETLKLFESPDCLGRTIRWAFQSPQLLIVPNAGAAANAFYHRESQSLQFFAFEDQDKAGQLAYTGASHDIVAHETGHAILDGVAPWLYDASTPQSLAIHESIADLTSLFAAVGSRTLALTALQYGPDLTGVWLFSAIARDLRDLAGDPIGLRSLVDPDPSKPLKLSDFGPDGAPPEPHRLSVVLSRAFYAAFLDAYDARLPDHRSSRGAASRGPDLDLPNQQSAEQAQQEVSQGPLGGANQDHFLALRFAGQLVKRVLIRGLDYLPPGDIGFLEVARAVIACDTAAHPVDSTGFRKILAARLIERGIGASESDLASEHSEISDPLTPNDLNTLVSSNWHAMHFVEDRRGPLGIPDGIPFEVLPRLVTNKELVRGPRRTETPELRSEVVLKIAWKVPEKAAVSSPLPPQRWVQRGATVVFDQATGAVCAFVDHRSAGGAAERDYLARTLQEGRMLTSGPTVGFPADPFARVGWRVSGDAFELIGAARTLHLVGQ